MPKISRLRLSSLAILALATAAAAGSAGCGDNKPAGRPMTDGGADGATCSGSFISPATGATLTVTDAIGGTCTGGFKTDVRVATSQPEGTSVDLMIGAAKVATATVQGAEVKFTNVTIPEGANTLQATFSATCSLTATVTVDCDLPTCSITKPVISPTTHPLLNGVPAANGGDRVSAAGSPYQVEFDVVTNVEDGQPVTLNITNPNGGGGTTVVTGSSVGGMVKFAGVTLVPDGNYMIEAQCTNRAGAVGHSANGTYPVDSTPPALTISSPMNGKYFGPADLTGTTTKTFAVCAQTPDKDATSDTAKNLSVAVGTGSPDPTTGYVALTAQNTDGCVNVACTSAMPFDLTVTLRDAAGNSTVKTVNNITCATNLPSIEIVSPVGDSAPFSDPLKHLLASTSTNTFKDQAASTAGAQWTVVACADTAGMVTLFGGTAGGTLTVLAGPVATASAAVGDNCRSGYPFVAKFPAVTLPESQEDTDGSISVATELRADIVTPTTATNQSNEVDIWVDSSAPNIAASIPADLCGKVYQSLTDVIASVRLLSTTPTVSMMVTAPGGSMSYSPTYLNGFATFNNVTFPLGTDQVTATGTDKAGNSSSLVTPCTVTVGTPPVVTFVTPQAANTLCAAGQTNGTCIPDGNASAGWQGDLDVTVSVSGVAMPTGTVTFSVGTSDVGTVAIDGTGHARLSNVTIPDGRAVVLTAATSDISSHGIGMASETLVVDTVIPDRVVAVTATVKDRRQTSFHLAWTAPGDGGQPLYSYIVKVSKNPITFANFDAATTVTYTGSPGTIGAADGIDATGLVIESNYYFAVVSVDAAGNRGAIATAGPFIAQFKMNVLVPPAGGPANERFGAALDGVADLNGDGRTDILVGTTSGQRVYVFNGSATFNTVTAPSTVITGQASVGFGRQFIDVGDIDADGKDDYAISAPQLGNGRIYIFKGRAAWNASYNADSDADYILDLGSSYAATQLGNSMTRLGDFNGDGVDDFAAGALAYNGGRGRVVVILGRSGFTATNPNVQTIDGDPAYPSGNFGATVLGMGRFYVATAGTTLVVNANSAGPNLRGRVYAFPGIAGTSAAINATAANNFVEGPVDNASYGNTIALLGSVGSGPGLAIGTGRATSLGVGIVDLHFGSTIAGPFVANPLRFFDSLSVTTADIFGRIVGGCAFPGTSISVSILGDGKPDLVMVPSGESSGGPPRIYIVDGARLFAITTPADVVTSSDVILPMPTDWKAVPLQRNGMIRDLDGDGYADFAIGESIPTGVGRLAVFW